MEVHRFNSNQLDIKFHKCLEDISLLTSNLDDLDQFEQKGHATPSDVLFSSFSLLFIDIDSDINL